ncbi:hypothetical protein PanWU01x14_174450 [Parasponia andersonii]|uniref:Uncharacterized protein n=1 Tax=Parasponia andersonii TaxID=3476 RepID=A0A2P5C8F1_PARAD|nr:hypothetical protein PanWU01x14_174450 [Parasponia andersonii]
MPYIVGPVPEPYATGEATRIARDLTISYWTVQDGPAQPNPNLDSWGSEASRVCYLGTVALISIVGRVGSPKGLQTEYNGKQPTAPNPDRVFNAILGRCVHQGKAVLTERRFTQILLLTD